MIKSRLAIFDDARGRWGPLTDRRAVFDLRSGAHTTHERIARRLGAPEALFVPPALVAVTAERHPGLAINPAPRDGDWLLVSGRWAGVDDALAQRIAALPRATALLQADGELIATHLSATQARHALEAGCVEAPARIERDVLDRNVLLGRPWHVLDALDAALRCDLEASTLPEARDHPPEGAYIVGGHPVRIAPSATVMPTAVLNATHGPIVIERDARLDPFAALEGPCYVGPGAHLASHAMLRAATAIGPHCKVGGEIKHSIIHGHTNKAHLGYLGDSLVGEWTNLGADTNVSNLKNTYGHVRVALEADDPSENTGRTNHGPIIGDFVRTAIGTRLLTGSVVGTGAMLALSALAPKHVHRLSFCTDAGVSTHDLDALLATAHRMMSRHDIELTDAEASLLRHLHAQATAHVA